MTIGERIKTYRQLLGISQEELGSRIGVQKSAIHKYETGLVVNLKSSTIQKLADALNVTPSFLLGFDSAASTLPPNAYPYHPTHRIPILGRISAGQPLYAEENIEGYIFTELNGDHEYYALRIMGDSMNAMNLFEGDIVIVRRQECVDNGQVAVVLIDGEDATVKRFMQSGDTVTLIPSSTNPAHMPQIYDKRETNIVIQGLVVQLSRDIK